MEVVIADTGFVVALANRSDQRHAEVRPIYLQYPQILLPQLVLVEVAYLIGRDIGIATVVKFLKGLPASRFELIEATDQDIARIAEILEQYADSKVDFVDASVMAIAERLKVKTILTIDQRDFRLFRPSHCQSFTLLP
ncbi:MAG: PIN domain-containing protein [Cyanobacteria bacterium P01_G01_bin.38]